MSVDYTAIYGYGFMITADEAANIPEDMFDEFIDSDYTICVDNYADESNYFFGLKLTQASPGYIYELPVVDNYAHETFMAMMHEFKRFFPHKDALQLRHYLIHRVW
jgi:hypothetical protein